MNAYENLLTSRFCKENANYIKRVVMENIDDDNYFDYASPIKFGYISMNKNAEFLTPAIRTKATKLSIHLYGNDGYEIDDVIVIEGKEYRIENIVKEVITKGFNKANHFFINLK